MAELLYRALKRCRVGRLREPGEVFAWEQMKPMPSYLEEADGEAQAEEEAPAAQAKGGKPAAKGKAAKTAKGGKPAAATGPTLEDIGGGKVKDADQVTSVDMIKQ